MNATSGGAETRRGCPLTIAILTRNEEALIARAVASASFADEVLVLDSESVDRTREIAASAGARVVEQPWLGWRDQHQKATDLARHDWVMKLDADEIISPELRRSICAALDADPDPADGFVVERIDDFLGVAMPSTRRRKNAEKLVRLFNRTRSRWDPDLDIHEAVMFPGAARRLSGPLLHWRAASLHRMVETFNANSEVESRDLVRRRPEGPSAFWVAVKPALRFGWSYVWCGGWRFGMRGFLRAALQAFAEFLALAKAWETTRAGERANPPPPVSAVD